MTLALDAASPPSPIPLGAKDMKDCLSALKPLYAAQDMTTFPTASLRVLNLLIPSAAFSSYNEIDIATSVARVFYEPPEVHELAESLKPGLWTYRDQHPLMHRLNRGGDNGVWKISDFVGQKEMHGCDLYREVLAKLGVEDTLSLPLQGHQSLRIFYAINGPGIFSERDRTICTLLQPHFVQAFENALAFTDARALALLSSRAISDTGSHGLMLVHSGGRIIHANNRAMSHITEAFGPGNGELLPGELLRWMNADRMSVERPALPFETATGGVAFVFRGAPASADHWIIATRRTDDAALVASLSERLEITSRQGEVLLWLSRGKTNSEISTILELSERTVAKHLQLLFPRLGVENRHGALLKVGEIIGLN